jgi:hypothetical protein
VLAIAFVAGALFSYTVELLQFFVPARDSGWGDVVTNSTGSVLGSLVYEFGGTAILSFASRVESAFVTWLNWRRVIVGLLIYMAVWLAVAIHFQRQVRITDWAPRSMLLRGMEGCLKLSSGTAPFLRPSRKPSPQVVRKRVLRRSLLTISREILLFKISAIFSPISSGCAMRQCPGSLAHLG